MALLIGEPVAADISGMIEALKSFYDFSGKTVLLVGAGGGQLLDGVRAARKLVAIDRDADALRAMMAVATSKGMEELVEPLHADWDDLDIRGDTVYFEFCLHEMPDPGRALRHARSLAPEVLVFDHLPDSEWARCAGEAELVSGSTEALSRCPIKRSSAWCGEQRFADYAELWGRLSRDPRTREADIAPYRGRRDITIPMSCGLTLL